MKTLKAWQLRWLMNVWPPFLGMGVHVTRIEPDYSYIRVELRQRFYNRNYVGVHFGGSLFAMTDPFYMLMLLHRLGRDYVVWDQRGDIEFCQPGRGCLSAEFEVNEALLERIKHATAGGEAYRPLLPVVVRNADGEVVAKGQHQLYVRRKASKREA